MLKIYTDGSCHFNPGPGGFGVVVYESWDGVHWVIIDAYQEKECNDTTNNRMEMKAILWALKNYGDGHLGNGCIIPTVYSDSAYCVNTFNDWIWKWKANGWKRPKGKPVENLDLVMAYDKLISMGYKMRLIKVSGHTGEEGNELADKLATGRIKVEDIIKED